MQRIDMESIDREFIDNRYKAQLIIAGVIGALIAFAINLTIQLLMVLFAFVD